MFKLEEEFKKEKLSDSLKQTLCNKLEELLMTLDINSAEAIQLLKPDVRVEWFMMISNNRNYYTDLLKKYQQTAESRNQTSLVSTTSAGGTDPNETVVQTGIAVKENVEENVDVSSRHSETQRSRKEPSIANSHSSRRREIDHLELENMRAKKRADQRLRERQSQLEKEREEIELCRRQEELRLHLQQQQQEQELRLQLQQQKDELRLRQHERELENEKKKAEADEEEIVLKLELTNWSSRASGSEAGDLENVGSRRKPAILQDWFKSVAERSGPGRPTSPNVVVEPPKNVTQKWQTVQCIPENYHAVPIGCRNLLTPTTGIKLSKEIRNPEINKGDISPSAFVQDDVSTARNVNSDKQAEKSKSKAKLSQQIHGES